MTAALARGLRDGEVVVMGANSMIPMAAARLAQLTHAPNLTLISGPSGGVNSLVEPLAPSSGDYANLVAEAALSFDDVMMLQLGSRIDVFFAGGLQIDRHGNCTLALAGSNDSTILRGPGSAGIPWATRSRRTILFTTSHTRRVFVPEVDFVSLRGWTSPDVVLEGVAARPDLLVTPLAVMDFTSTGEMRLLSAHSGVTLEQIVENTGFDLVLPDGELLTTPDPTPEMMQIMRSFDVDGLLAIAV